MTEVSDSTIYTGYGVSARDARMDCVRGMGELPQGCTLTYESPIELGDTVQVTAKVTRVPEKKGLRDKVQA